jgi:hypothetical protein
LVEIQRPPSQYPTDFFAQGLQVSGTLQPR